MRQHFQDPNVLAPKSRPKTHFILRFFLPLSPFSDVQNILQCVDFAEPPGGYLCCWGVPAAESEPKPLSPCEVRLEGQFIILTRKPERTDLKKVWFYLLGSCSQKLPWTHELKHEPEKLPLTKATNAHPHWWGAISGTQFGGRAARPSYWGHLPEKMVRTDGEKSNLQNATTSWGKLDFTS